MNAETSPSDLVQLACRLLGGRKYLNNQIT